MTAREPTLRTERLVLRRWRDADLELHAAMNADPVVMEHFPSVLTREESDAVVQRIDDQFDAHGFGLWAVEVPGVTPFAGWVGLTRPRFDAPFTPCVEVGWRLRTECWGRGYATEGARAAIRFGFDEVGLDEIVSFTVPQNERSRAVMAKLGMTHDPADDFDHPLVEPHTPWHRHVLYRLPRAAWSSRP